jgi:outer membrane protein assembly factor BamB
MLSHMNRWIACAALVCCSIVGLASSGAAASPPSSGAPRLAARAGTEHVSSSTRAWTTEGGGPDRWSVALGSPSLRRLHRLWSDTELGGPVYAEPLIGDQLVFVATETDVVDALSAATGRLVWRRRLGTPVPSDLLPCGDIAPSVGVTSTMLLDLGSRLLFASGSVEVDGAVHHRLFALDARTGRVVFTRDLDQRGWDASAQLQRTALALDGGEVLVGFGGNAGDCAPYHGYLVAVPVSGHGPLRVFRVPTQRQGAIWAPGGVAVAPDGAIYLATGNGIPASPYDGAESVIELSQSLHELGYFAPGHFAQDSENDLDLGSTSPILLPHSLVFQVGKSGEAYLLSAEHLGGIAGELTKVTACSAYGGSVYASSTLYLGCPSGITELHVGPGDRLRRGWHAPAGIGGPPILAGGLLFTIDRYDDTLVGLAPSSGEVLVTERIGPVEHFATPAAGDGLLVVAGDGFVTGFAGSDGARWRPSPR